MLHDILNVDLEGMSKYLYNNLKQNVSAYVLEIVGARSTNEDNKGFKWRNVETNEEMKTHLSN